MTQDVFLKLFTSLSSFDGRSRFSTWMYSFTYNFCVNHVKKKSVNKHSDSIDDHEYYLTEEEDVMDETLFQMKVDKLQRALEMIPPEDKAILLLKYQDGISLTELAKVFDLGESAVKMRLKRAKLKVVEAHNRI